MTGFKFDTDEIECCDNPKFNVEGAGVVYKGSDRNLITVLCENCDSCVYNGFVK